MTSVILIDYGIFSYRQGILTMAEPALKEFTPLTPVLQLFPRKAQSGFSVIDIHWTCLEVTDSFLAVGSNVGKLYLYDRHRNKLEKFQCQVRIF